MKKTTLLFLTFFIAIAISAQVNLEQGLVAYYPFNGNANDETGNGHDGTVNGAILVSDRFGTQNSAYEFNGDGEITVADHDSLELTGSFSISVWVKRYGDGSHQHLIQKHVRGVDNDGSWVLYIDGNNPTNIKFVATPDFTSNLFPNSNIVQDEWINIIFTHDKLLSEWKFYINGALGANGNKVFDIQNTSSDLCFGFDHFGPSYPSAYYYNGILDDIRIYNRTINEEEVLAIYNYVSSINEIGKKNFTIYPNPVSNSINLNVQAKGTYEILSIEGECLIKSTFDQNLKNIAVTNLPNGIYVIRLTTENEIFSRIFIKI